MEHNVIAVAAINSYCFLVSVCIVLAYNYVYLHLDK